MHTLKESAKKASVYKFYTYLSMGEIMPFKYYRIKNNDFWSKFCSHGYSKYRTVTK